MGKLNKSQLSDRLRLLDLKKQLTLSDINNIHNRNHLNLVMKMTI